MWDYTAVDLTDFVTTCAPIHIIYEQHVLLFTSNWFLKLPFSTLCNWLCILWHRAYLSIACIPGSGPSLECATKHPGEVHMQTNCHYRLCMLTHAACSHMHDLNRTFLISIHPPTYVYMYQNHTPQTGSDPLTGGQRPTHLNVPLQPALKL